MVRKDQPFVSVDREHVALAHGIASFLLPPQTLGAEVLFTFHLVQQIERNGVLALPGINTCQQAHTGAHPGPRRPSVPQMKSEESGPSQCDFGCIQSLEL